MKKVLSYTFTALFTALAAAYLVVTLTLSRERHEEQTCTGLKVEVLDSNRSDFITRADVRDFLDKEYGTYKGEHIADINLSEIESIINKRTAVYNSEAFITTDGKLNIVVTQRTPVLRFQSDKGEYFTDAEGFLFPMQGRNTARVQSVSGHIPLSAGDGFKGELKDSTEHIWLKNMIDMSRFISKYKMWDNVEMSVEQNGDIVLKPEHEKVQFIFGGPDDYERKFSRIRRYYSAVVPVVGDSLYRSVSVKYNGQIVCKKH